LKRFHIEVSDQQNNLKVDPRQLCRTVRFVLRQQHVDVATVSIVLVDNDAIRRLKARYFGRRVVTDVISFDLRDEACSSDGVQTVDCEIVVNAQRAVTWADRSARDPRAELNLYVIHGLLHQLGYDDISARKAQVMHAREDQLLIALGFGSVFHVKR
jgi:probable rRNA maturation factor